MLIKLEVSFFVHHLAERVVVLPSHRKPTRPQMKSLQLWQKVGLVRVTFLRQ